MTLRLYADGSCYPNPGGTAAWAWVLVRDGRPAGEASGPVPVAEGHRRHSSNRAELWAAIEGLRSLPLGVAVELVSDSTYVTRGAVGGVRRCNLDLWELLDAEAAQRTVIWTWVRGHRGDRWNGRADALAAREVERVRRASVTSESARIGGAWAVRMGLRSDAAMERDRERRRRVAPIATLGALAGVELAVDLDADFAREIKELRELAPERADHFAELWGLLDSLGRGVDAVLGGAGA